VHPSTDTTHHTPPQPPANITPSATPKASNNKSSHPAERPGNDNWRHSSHSPTPTQNATTHTPRRKPRPTTRQVDRNGEKKHWAATFSAGACRQTTTALPRPE
jgi:hypothetical protein